MWLLAKHPPNAIHEVLETFLQRSSFAFRTYRHLGIPKQVAPYLPASLTDKAKAAVKSVKQEAAKTALSDSTKHVKIRSIRQFFLEKNKDGNYFEPTSKFLVDVESTKNNCFLRLFNRSEHGGRRFLIQTFAGVVGYRKSDQQTKEATMAIASRFAQYCEELGVKYVDVRFIRAIRVADCLATFEEKGLIVTSLIHRPLVSHLHPRARKRRRV